MFNSKYIVKRVEEVNGRSTATNSNYSMHP